MWKVIASLAVTGLIVVGSVGCAEANRNREPALPTPDGHISGRVLLPNGKPGAGATVRLYYAHSYSGYGSQWLGETTADANGRFDLVNPGTPLRNGDACDAELGLCLVGVLRGYGADVVRVFATVRDGYTLSLSEPVTVSVRVLDTAGAPVAGATVVPTLRLAIGNSVLLCDTLEKQILLPQLCHPETDKGGWVTFRDLPSPPLAYVAYHAAKGAGAFVAIASGPLQPGILRSRLAPTASGFLRRRGYVITLDGGASTFKGRVVSAETGQPIPNARVSAAGPVWQPYRSWSVTDYRGEFDLTVMTLPVPADNDEAPWLLGLHLDDVEPQVRFAVTAVPVDVFGQKHDGLEIPVKEGALVTGVVVDEETQLPVAGASVGYVSDGNRGDSERGDRLTGADGRFAFRASGNEIEVSVRAAGPGRVLTSSAQQKIRVIAPVPEITLSVRSAPEAICDIKVKRPDGTQAQWVDLALDQAAIATYLGAYSNVEGTVRLGPVAAGVPVLIGGKELNGSSGKSSLLCAAAEITPEGPVCVTELTLRPSRQATVVLKDSKGNPASGEVNLALWCSPPWKNWPSRISASSKSEPGNAAKPLVVNGLLPGVDYAVATDLRNPEWVKWRFEEDDKYPRLELTIHDGALAVPIRTDADFRRDVETLADAIWCSPDPIQKHLTWYGLKDGVAVADAETKAVKRFSELLDASGIAPSAIAFGSDKVWLGTNKGLFAFDRVGSFWTRFAMGGTLVDVKVKALALSPEGVLSVKVAETGARERRFTYDTKSGKWSEE
jgi:hypothetical protein